MGTAGRTWIPVGRAAVAALLVVFVQTYRPEGSHPAPGFVHPAALALTLVLSLFAILQLTPEKRPHAAFASWALFVDAAVAVGFLGLYSFDPRPLLAPLPALVVVEGALVAGVRGALATWLAVTLGSALVAARSVVTAGVSFPALAPTLAFAFAAAAGVSVALVIGRLTTELELERNARIIEREGQRRRFHDIVWDLDAIVWESDSGSRQFYFVSHPAERITGYPVDRWLSEPGFRHRLIHPEDRRRAMEKYAEAASSGKHGQFEYRMVTSEDSTLWVTDRVTPVRDPDGKIRQLRGVTIDITRRKEAEEGLRNSFGMLFANNPQPMWAYDRETLRFLAVNDSAVELYGYDRDEFLQMRITDVCTPEEVDRLLMDMLRNRGAFERAGEWRHRRKDGSVIDVEMTSHTLQFERRKASLVMADNITDRKRAEKQLREAEVRFRTLVEQIPAVTYVSSRDDERSAIYMSPQAQEMLGYGQDVWRADPTLWAKLLHPEDRGRVLSEAARANEASEPFVTEYRLIAKDGSTIWVRDEAILLMDEVGQPQFWQGVMVDITDRKQAEREIAFLAYHDKLTGLPNRAMFQEVLDLALARARREDLAVAVLYLDLDNFKLVNDSLGHAAGDQLLREMATRLQAHVRDTNLVSRVGGDEFLMMAADLPRAAGDRDGMGANSPLLVAEGLARRIQDSLRQPFVLEGTEVYVSASIGISVYPLDAEDAATLLKNSDVAMYRSKKERPGGCMIFAEDAGAKLPDLSFATRLRKAVEAGQWELHYQPIVDLATGRATSVEALVRWRDPEVGLIPPNDFIPLAEELGLIDKIGDWVLGELCMQQRAWREQMGLSLGMSFNLSPRQLWEPDIVERIMNRLQEHRVDPSTVVVEITESAAMTDLDRTQPILWELHRNGVKLAIDDFGTGYSSLARLRNLPVDLLKIDRFFVRDLPGDRDARSMVEAIIRMALGLDMQPLAEGIETEQQWRFLADNGCTLGQGFYFSRPVPAAELVNRLGPELRPQVRLA